MSVDLDERLHDALDAQARALPVGPPPALEVIETASTRRTRRATTRRRTVVVVAIVAAFLAGVLALRVPRSSSDIDTAAPGLATGRPVKIGLNDPTARIVWAADESQVKALQRQHPDQDVAVSWFGLFPVPEPAPGAFPSTDGPVPDLVRYRSRPGDPTSSFVEVDTLTAGNGPRVRSPWPTPTSGTYDVNGGVGWFQPNPVDILMFAWRTPNGEEALVHAFNLSRDQIVDIARSAQPDAKGQMVPTRVPAGMSREMPRKRDESAMLRPPYSQVEYGLSGSRSVQITTRHGGNDELDDAATGALLLAVRVDIATVRGHKALITSNGAQDFTIVWGEPENGMVVTVHAVTSPELVPEIVNDLAAVDPAIWRTMTEQHSPKAQLAPKVRTSEPWTKATEVPLPPSED